MRSGPTTIGSRRTRIASRIAASSCPCSPTGSRRAAPANGSPPSSDAAVPCSPIRSLDEVFESPEGAALVDEIDDPARGGSLRLVANPLRFDGRRLPTRLPPPVLGADSEGVWGS